MSKKSGNAKYIFAALFAFMLAAALANAGISAQAQNTNSSTTTEEPAMQNENMNANMNTNMNANMNTNTGRRRGRRGRRGTRQTTNTNTSSEMNANTSGEMNTNSAMPEANMNANMSGEMQTGGGMTNTNTSMETDTGAMSPGAQADLSGTYTGTINYPEGGMTGEATLTITGNTFTLASGSTTQSGRITAVTTRGYTGATMQFGDTLPATIVSVRAWHTAPDRLRLMSVPGEKRQFSFATPNAGGSRRRRGRRG